MLKEIAERLAAIQLLRGEIDSQAAAAINLFDRVLAEEEALGEPDMGDIQSVAYANYLRSLENASSTYAGALMLACFHLAVRLHEADMADRNRLRNQLLANSKGNGGKPVVAKLAKVMHD